MTNTNALDISHLNPQQQEAVLHEEGPLLIIAGAGTGKTGVITHRIAHLIASKKARPDEILALTFTEKAAAEMEERVDRLVPYGFIDTWILTFHAFGDRVIREQALELGLPSNLKILTKPEQVVFIQDNLMAFDLNYYRPLSNPTKHIDALISHFSKLKDEIISPENYIALCEEKLKDVGDRQEWEKQLELAKAYQRYEELKEQYGYLDFGDQINLTIKLFKNNNDILKYYQKQFKYILVDEFQDTNYAQNELVKLLAGDNANITVVGDDNQSIYRFRGAAISNILEFKSHYPGAKEIVLTQNYRSTQQILDASYRLITHNNPDTLEFKYGISKKLKGQSKGPLPVHIHCDSVSSEADKIAQIIKEKYESGNYKLKDFAILVRKNSAGEDFMRALGYYGLPYKFEGSSGLYDRPEIRNIISFIKSITDYFSSLSMFHLAESEIYDFKMTDLVILNTYAKRHNRSLEWAMKKIDHIEELKDNLFDMPGGRVINFLADLDKFREYSKTDSAGQVVYAFLKETGYLKSLLQKAESLVANSCKEDSMSALESQVKISNIAKFFSKISAFESVSMDKSLINFKNHLETLIEAGDDPSTAEIDPDVEAVNILTAHKSKGLEFKVVFIANCVTNYFPSIRRSEVLKIPNELVKEVLPEGEERQVHLQEERRLFYVAMTRAKEELFFTSAEDYGGQRSKKVSQFVLEALDLPELDVAKYKLHDIEQIKRFEKPKGMVFELPKKFFTQGKLTLSPHQIDDYLSCPKKFEYIHILSVPIRAHSVVMYGSAIHKAIEEYFARKKAGFKVEIDDLWRVFEESWSSEGFITRDHEEERLKKGKQALLAFFEREEAGAKLPTKLEEWFYFNVPDQNLKIRGRYDAVYELDDFVEIRDFKTSEVENKEKADDKAKKNRQLSIYALSYLTNKGKIPDKLTLDFVDKGIVGESVRTEKDLNKVLEEIKTVVVGLESSDYKPSPGFGECGWCAFREICPHTLNDI
jgi:DNA helicase II / ATP-dependent DNA helicase PcrA